MRTFLKFKLQIFAFALSGIVLLIGCSSDDGTASCFPRSDVNASYNLGLPLFTDLQNAAGYVQLPADGTNGSRGLIIVNTGNSYRAYDRNAPHLCPGEDTTLEVVDGIKIVCPADGAEWILTSGQPLNDATQGDTPFRYLVNVQGNIITITN